MRKAYTAIPVERLERNFARILKLCASDLRLEVRTFLEHKACRFVERRSFHLAARIIISMRSIESKLDAELQALASAKEHTLEQRLQRQAVTQTSLSECDPEGESQEHSDGRFSDDKESSLPNVSHLRHFLLDGPPLIKLRENLKTFVEAAKVGHVDGSGEVKETTGSWEQLSAPGGEQPPKRPRGNKKQ